jgi:hypothetical protein
MTLDTALRALATLACVYVAGLFITVMSLSALEAATFSTGPFCSGHGCLTAANEHGPSPAARFTPASARNVVALLEDQRI